MLSLEMRSSTPTLPPSPDRHVVIADPAGTAVAYGWRRGMDHWISVPEKADFRFRPGSNVVTAHPVRGAAPEVVTDAYRGSVLPVAAQVMLGAQALHASAVMTPDGQIVAFGGRTGAGKTTIAVGLSRRGHRLWADDTVAFDVSAHGISALRLPFQLNLREPSAAF